MLFGGEQGFHRQVTYWLAAMEKGLIVEMPEKVSIWEKQQIQWGHHPYENGHQMEYGMVSPILVIFLKTPIFGYF